MSRAIAFLAGLGAGYLDGENKKREQARQDARDQREQDTYDMNMQDRQQAKADRDALREAGSPAVVSEGQLPGPVEPGADALPSVAKVNGRAFASRGVADDEAAKMNAPGAARTRVAAALAAQGNVVGADQLRTSGIQADAAQMALDKGKRDEANQIFDDGLRKALSSGGPQALAAFMSESHADGQQGGLKFQAVTSPDGKSWQMQKVGPDGVMQPFGGKFANDEGGMATAGLMLSRSTPDSAKVAHMLQVKEADRKQAHDEKALAISQQQANTQEQYRRDQAANMKEQRALEGQRIAALTAKQTAPGAPLQVTLKDKRDFESDYSSYIKDQFPVKEGADDKERAAMTAQANSARALASSLFENNAAVGVPLTAGSVAQAVELARDRKNVKVIQVNGQAYEGVVVNGQSIITSGALQRKAAAGAAPAAPVPAGVNPAQPAPPLSPAALASQGVASTSGAAPGLPRSPGGPAADPPEAMVFESARTAARLAQDRLLTYGSRQRMQDPAGFQAAVAARDETQARLLAAESAYQRAMYSTAGPVFRYPAP